MFSVGKASVENYILRFLAPNFTEKRANSVQFDFLKSIFKSSKGQGAAVLMSGLNIERILAAAIPVGIAQAALDCAIPYAHDRKQFGKSIGEFQLLQGNRFYRTHGTFVQFLSFKMI